MISQGLRHLNALILVSLCACGEPAASDPQMAASARPPEAPPPPEHWGKAVKPADPRPRETSFPAPSIEAAVMPDSTYAGNQLVRILRAVYRVSFAVPAGFREKQTSLLAPAGELFVDLSRERLRARFVGPGWPIDEGSEIRLRDDTLGVYVFDGRGGRPLGPGDMATWFEGRKRGKSSSSVGVVREFGPAGAYSGELMCSLLAEWTGQPRDALARRCSHGAVPPRFRFGPWRGELTAVVPLEVAMHTVRADESRPPAGLATADSRSSVDAAELAHIAPVHGAPTASKPSAALEVVNNTAARAIIMVQGVPVGWVNAYRRGRFEGFRPGRYRVGALRPLGALRLAPKLVELPGEVVLGGPLQPLVSPRNAPTAG